MLPYHFIFFSDMHQMWLPYFSTSVWKKMGKKTQGKSKGQGTISGISVTKIQSDITEHAALVPSMVRNRSVMPRSGFWVRLVFSGREICSLTADQHCSKRISSLEMSKVSQWISSNHHVPTSRPQLRAWEAEREEPHLKAWNKYFLLKEAMLSILGF